MSRRILDAALTVPSPATATTTTNGNRTRDSFISETNFDTNMVIILAALLCALICALGLNSIVRCVLRCSNRLTETPEQAAARLARTGLKKSRLRQLPVAVYGSGMEIPSSECPICLGDFEDGEKVRVLPKCNHGFHVRCIDTWLVSNSSCPNCRHSLLEQKQTTSFLVRGRNEIQNPENGGESSSENERKELPENVSGGEEGRVVITVHDELS
ncbi:hypothetical protein CsatB_000225 [Cannabis sativa]